METNLSLLKKQAQEDIENSRDLRELNEVLKIYLGKEGKLTLVLRSLPNLPKARRAEIGGKANELKNYFEKNFDEKRASLAKITEKKKEWIDITVPGKKPAVGHLHPLTQVQREVEDIFESLGFSVISGPDIETEWYNFDALNIPKDHPARDQWDTFYLKAQHPTSNIQNLLLRTHTSPGQVRFMEKNNPPLRVIIPGTVFRHEATDASHEFQLCQVEGLMVDKEISAASFKAIIQEFFKKFFKKEVKIRLRPDFFPFTEPSFDVSISCLVCGAKGCPVCKGSGWVEMAGAGMGHPNVFKNSGLNPRDWQGWAFGFGLERLTMMKYKIDDIRLFRSGDLRFLNQF